MKQVFGKLMGAKVWEDLTKKGLNTFRPFFHLSRNT